MQRWLSWRRLAWLVAAGAGVGCAGLGFARAQQKQEASEPAFEMLPVQGNIHVLVGAGGNIAVQIGPQGTLVVDSGLAKQSEDVLAAIRKLTAKPIQYIINTHVHPDHTGGNDLLRKTGKTYTGTNVTGNPSDVKAGAQIIAHNNVLVRMNAPAGPRSSMPVEFWPTLTYSGASKQMLFNGERIEILHQPEAHTDGDSFVFFRGSDVISAGDIFLSAFYPFIDVELGGSIQGEIEALNHLVKLAVPSRQEKGGTSVIPGHGQIVGRREVVQYRDMVSLLRDKIQAAIKSGMTLAQIKAANLTVDYDSRYGPKGDYFIESVYKSLTQAR
ncbi:MAG: MBL fold metallo-hydrolase [Acidobacteriota bacterium]|nr:MBL fold metallo-hydrolase [Acidobacteriota bacterium]